MLSEGLNLQDATRLINYDLHWNPVRLMQRIGRVDRRMNPDVEERLLADHPDQKKLRGDVAYWNFLPPSELDGLLKLYSKVAHKTLRISKTFGIEGRKLLTPEDEYEALRRTSTTPTRARPHLSKTCTWSTRSSCKDYPDLKERLDSLPGRVFSGKEHPSPQRPGPSSSATRFRLPITHERTNVQTVMLLISGQRRQGTRNGICTTCDTEQILEEPSEILDLIRSKPDTPRHRDLPEERLTEIRKKVERHIKNTYLKSVVAPVGREGQL